MLNYLALSMVYLNPKPQPLNSGVWVRGFRGLLGEKDSVSWALAV